MLIRQHGETVYEKCFGYGNLENQLKIKNDSILHVASISKEFTVLSIPVSYTHLDVYKRQPGTLAAGSGPFLPFG